MTHLYKRLAHEFMDQIQAGLLRSGDRLPGVRGLSQQRNVSVATVISAYRMLEDAGCVEVRDRSGYYVKSQRRDERKIAVVESIAASPSPISGQQMALTLVKAACDPQIMQFGAAVPHRSFLPEADVARSLQNVIKTQRGRLASYEMPPGAEELRRQIALRMGEWGALVYPDEIVITSGCQEALQLALRALTKPGDIVAVESPTFYGALQVLDALRLEAVEIPTDPESGIALDTLAFALEKWPIKAVVVQPNMQNPLGFTMSDERKRQLVSLVRRFRVPLIEDDIFGDLSFRGPRPRPIKALCVEDDIIYCSSYSKTISPGLRVGWVVGGRHHPQLEYLKYVSNIASGSVAQLAAADYLASGRYERYLRVARSQYRLAVDKMSDAVLQLFPKETKITQPSGGYVIWVQLPEELDTFALAKLCLVEKISIAPGSIFSASMKFRNCMRISCACVWDRSVEHSLLVLAKLIASLARHSSGPPRAEP